MSTLSTKDGLDAMALDALRVQTAARELLDAMDRQHGTSPFSYNVEQARSGLRQIFPRTVLSLDRADKL